ncbi:hypothetical protein ABZ464_32700 [Streptomyces sp. NPDC005820]|uniref:hypothetical protein n=1 Tax=Streptomyces sp. NPDC005820 TaxID=3157069 RepID=UPI0033DAD5C4
MIPRTAFLGAPLLTFAYGVIRIVDGLDGVRGPGLAWTVGHLAFITAMPLFTVAFGEMSRRAGSGRLATALSTVATTGALCLTAQFTIDVVAGALTEDHDTMSEAIARVSALPGVSPIVYQVGPYLFYGGMLALVLHLAATRRVKVWTPLLVLCDLLLPLLDKDFIPLGATLLLVSFTSLSRRTPPITASPLLLSTPTHAKSRTPGDDERTESTNRRETGAWADFWGRWRPSWRRPGRWSSPTSRGRRRPWCSRSGRAY